MLAKHAYYVLLSLYALHPTVAIRNALLKCRLAIRNALWTPALVLAKWSHPHPQSTSLSLDLEDLLLNQIAKFCFF
jgi:hypothetical protein